MNVSTAYDLSRFEARPREKKPQLKAVKTVPKKKTAAMRLSPVVAVLVSAVLVFICAFMIYTNVMINETTADITRLNKEITNLQSEQVRLDSELNVIMSRGNIEERAAEMGMYQAGKLQVECIEVNTGDKIEVIADERNMFEKIHDFVSNLF